MRIPPVPCVFFQHTRIKSPGAARTPSWPRRPRRRVACNRTQVENSDGMFSLGDPYLCCMLPGCWDLNCLPTDGFSIKQLKAKLLAGEQKATEIWWPFGFPENVPENQCIAGLWFVYSWVLVACNIGAMARPVASLQTMSMAVA